MAMQPAVAAGPDVIRQSVPDNRPRSSIASAQTGFPIQRRSQPCSHVWTVPALQEQI